jgi:hypothetical protein
MYKSNYKSIFRCHTLDECLSYTLESKTTKVDLFLYLLDVTDILLNHADGSMLFDDDAPYLRLVHKLEQFTFLNWKTLLVRIPGQLNGWCEGMLVYTCVSLCRWLASKPGCTILSNNLKSWMKENKLRVNVSYDVSQWTVSQLLYALDVLEHRWDKIRPLDDTLLQYLNILEYRAAWFMTHTCSTRFIDVKKYRLQVDEHSYQIHPMLIFEFFARFGCLRRSFCQYTMWDCVPPVKEMPETRWQEFIENENRHLTIRKFRDCVEQRVWENIIRMSDNVRSSYRVRGSRVSNYQSLAENRPLAYLETLSNITAYKKPPELHQHKHIRDSLHLQIVHAHFMSNYNVSFLQFFYCSEEKSWEHRTYLSHIVVPIVVKRSQRYDVIYKGVLQLVPHGTFCEAFLRWLLVVRQDYRGILYGTMDFSRLCRALFDPPQIAQKRTLGENVQAYKWDV